MTRKEIYNEKGYWKRRFKQLDLKVLQLLNYERSGALDVTLTDYFVYGNEAVKIGITGEEILDNMVKHGLSDEPIAEMRNMINMVEVFSQRLKQVAESKWQKSLESFPIFKSSTATIGELLEKTRAIREMNEMLENEDSNA